MPSLSQLPDEAKIVPLTGQVRVDRAEIDSLLAENRAELGRRRE